MEDKQTIKSKSTESVDHQKYDNERYQKVYNPKREGLYQFCI